MTDKDYDKLIIIKYTGGGLWQPSNEAAFDLASASKIGDVSYFKLMTARDLNFHRCYFKLLRFIYGYMPDSFKRAVSRDGFYLWLKHLKKDYSLSFSFRDDTKISDILDFCIDIGLSADAASSIAERYGKTELLEYDSISFGNKSQEQFVEYVKTQLPWIYENVLRKYYKDEVLNDIINTIEEEFEKFLQKL